MVIEKLKGIAFKYTKLGRPSYPYQTEPIQLAALVQEIERLKDRPGCIIEIGVARGMTTRFLVEHLQRSGRAAPRYFAIDTFSSFTKADLAYEVEKRGKTPLNFTPFKYNDYDAWRRNFAEFTFVHAIQADCADVDYDDLAPVKLAFLDVDLYKPTAAVLPALYNALVPGGVILVDDVAENNAWDGSHQAYMEFCEQRGFPIRLIGNKCGAIYKDEAS